VARARPLLHEAQLAEKYFRSTRKNGIEEIEGPHRANADEVEQRAFHAQVGEKPMQALEDSICAKVPLRFVWHNLLV
jgi:hypothetical protein